ncbi:gas vesicle protein GvpG [Falsiroseomonas selenitidurans]|uniref:Gas vesicle protein n=1 Tax=Falsiroseomonas selenitidurans TaxID=2716335 RepID=A0ABX1EBH6_9PROT|nr:gas vesicle protein GvpG [Falsiroseomonas selenitidurans]NKC34546.1 gas vesicle protein [Falsiroseomonas selenitidurans]
MGLLRTLLTLPIALPLNGIGWVAGQVAQAVDQQWYDPRRVEAALLALERRLEAGEITEAEFEAAEAEQLAELAAIRAARG